jgi:hypothetical protein
LTLYFQHYLFGVYLHMFLIYSLLTYFRKFFLWLWSYGSWIYNYLCNQCLSPLKLQAWTCSWRGVLDTTLCDKDCQWLATGWWFSLVSSINKTDHHDITEILLKEALNRINQTKPNLRYYSINTDFSGYFWQHYVFLDTFTWSVGVEVQFWVW